jgi:hypothetical protein
VPVRAIKGLKDQRSTINNQQSQRSTDLPTYGSESTASTMEVIDDDENAARKT